MEYDGRGGTSWLNQSPDLHWYWDDGSYVETAEASAQKIFYNMGDHSAIKSPTHSGMYESKWGSAPRMRHAPNYGPAGYKMDYRKYYKIVLAITGPSMVGGTTSGRYTPEYMPSSTTVTWTYDTNLLTKVSSSATEIVLKPKTATTVGDATIRATFTHSNGVIRDELYDVGVNGPHWKNVQLVVKKSSDGAVVYPTGGLCPNTYYYAYLNPGSTTLTDVNWGASSQLQVLSTSDRELYFRTLSAGWGILNITAKTIYGVTKPILGITLTGSSSCSSNPYYLISSIPSSNIVAIKFDLQTFNDEVNGKIYTKSPSFDIRIYSITGVMVKQARSAGENVQLDVSTLSNGPYVVHVYDNINTTPQTQIIQIKH